MQGPLRALPGAAGAALTSGVGAGPSDTEEATLEGPEGPHSLPAGVVVGVLRQGAAPGASLGAAMEAGGGAALRPALGTVQGAALGAALGAGPGRGVGKEKPLTLESRLQPGDLQPRGVADDLVGGAMLSLRPASGRVRGAGPGERQRAGPWGAARRGGAGEQGAL